MEDNTPIKCHSKECQRDAFVEVFWPGEDPPPKMCATCALKAQAIASAMGFKLVVRRLDA